MLLDEVRHVVDGEHLVEDAVGLEDHDGALGAEALAARGDDLDFVGEASLVDLGLEGRADLEGFVGDASRARADEQMGSVGLGRVRGLRVVGHYGTLSLPTPRA